MAQDLDAVAANYDALHEGGESWESIAGRVETVGDARLAAFLRQRAAGGDAAAAVAPPVERSAGNKSVAAQEAGQPVVGETPEQVAAELAAEGGEK